METPIIGGAEGGGEPAAALIKDTTTNDFVADVIDASHDAVVLVDFWAPWCGPCKQLTPVLEKVVNGAGGAVRLVKLNIDEHPAVPTQMGIQSIPAVFAFKGGRPVDGFMGALPESQVRAFIKRVAGEAAKPPSESALEAGDAAFEAGDTTGAARHYAVALQQDGANAAAIGGLAKCYVRAGDLDLAGQTLAMAPDGASDPALASARAMLDLARKAGDGGDVKALRAKVKKNPKNHQARYDLAIALNAAGDRMGAMEELLAVIGADRAWNDEAARKQLLQFFEAWGGKDPATVAGRQKLSSLLFA